MPSSPETLEDVKRQSAAVTRWHLLSVMVSPGSFWCGESAYFVKQLHRREKRQVPNVRLGARSTVVLNAVTRAAVCYNFKESRQCLMREERHAPGPEFSRLTDEFAGVRGRLGTNLVRFRRRRRLVCALLERLASCQRGRAGLLRPRSALLVVEASLCPVTRSSLARTSAPGLWS